MKMNTLKLLKKLKNGEDESTFQAKSFTLM